MKKTFSTFCVTLLTLAIAGCASWGRDREKAELYLQMGSSLLEEGNYPSALTALLKANELDPENPLILNSLGQVYFLRERFSLAEKQFRNAVTIEKNFTEAHNNLARVLIEEEKFIEAEKEIQIVLKDLTYGSQDRAYINLGLLKFNQKDYYKAELAFRDALKTKNDDCIASNYLGRSIFEQKEYPKATEILDRAIGFCQKILYDEPHYYSAVAYFRTGNKEKAIARFEELLKYYPDGKYREKAKGMLELIRKGNQ